MATKEFFDFAERLGLALFPCAAGCKTPVPGFLWKRDSSKDRRQWEMWETQFPGANFGIDCAKSDVIGIDIDVMKVGQAQAWQTYHNLCLSWGLPDALWPCTISARGGWHVLVKQPPNCPPLTQRDLASCINTRCSGYLVAPGSVFEGHEYLLTPRAIVHDVAPAGLIAALSAPLATEHSIQRESDLSPTAMRLWLEWMRERWQNREVQDDENPWFHEWSVDFH